MQDALPNKLAATSSRLLLVGGLVPFALCCALLAAGASSAFAHAAFFGSTPEPGTRLGASPNQISLKFTEPLIRKLSKATLVNAATGNEIAAAPQATGSSNELLLRPTAPLGRAAYRVEWHTVSPVDGHALEGSFGFGVRTAAVGGSHQLTASPLSRSGWLRITLRALLYASLFFFGGGLICAALLGKREPAGWLVPKRLWPALRQAGTDPDRLARRIRHRLVLAGWFATAFAAATVLAEAADASGALSLHGARDFLLTNDAGIARVATVVALAAATLLATTTQFRWGAAVVATLPFLAIAVGGHANSANYRFAAVATDWIHLLAGAVWVGGIAQIVSTWLPVLRGADQQLRSGVMRAVLERFGDVALPAFLLVAATGLTNALIELGRLDALWQSAYGRTLAVKVALVGLIALASYLHAVRLRPKLLAANPHPPKRLQRRHWRLLSIEPSIGVAVVAVAAVLVAFPLPPRQLGEADEAEAAACEPNCPLPKPAPDELSVAESAGSRIAAFWLRRDGDQVKGTLRLMIAKGAPVDAPVRVPGSTLESCGTGCWNFNISKAGDQVSAFVQEKGKEYRASVPAHWQPQATNAQAQSLANRAQGTMRRLRSLREDARLSSGPGTASRTLYRLKAPDSFASSTTGGSETVVIGKRQWNRIAGVPWQAEPIGGVGAFRTRDFFKWTPPAGDARLLGIESKAGKAGKRIAEVALVDPVGAIWYRLQIDLSTLRVIEDRMVAEAHFMHRRYFAFNKPVKVKPPSHAIAP